MNPQTQASSESQEDGPSRSPEKKANTNGQPGGLVGWVKSLMGVKPETTLRETIEEYIDVSEDHDADAVTEHEKALLANILKLRDLKVSQIMVPRANIFSIELSTSHEELLTLLAEKQYSRIPVYRDTLDNVLGTVHVKDILATLAEGEKINLKKLVTEIPIVSPAMPMLDLLLKMRQSRRHMVLVVDEYGGIDGLVTIGDIIESIVGEIDDEHDIEEAPGATEKSDGSIMADARMNIAEFEEQYGQIFSSEEKEDSDTLGGLVATLAGRVPARGEVLTHETGMVFEILDADPRRINRVLIRNIPAGLG